MPSIYTHGTYILYLIDHTNITKKHVQHTYTHLAVCFHDSTALNRDALTHVMNKCIHQPICW